jgi:hypothetical protein
MAVGQVIRTSLVWSLVERRSAGGRALLGAARMVAAWLGPSRHVHPDESLSLQLLDE